MILETIFPHFSGVKTQSSEPIIWLVLVDKIKQQPNHNTNNLNDTTHTWNICGIVVVIQFNTWHDTKKSTDPTHTHVPFNFANYLATTLLLISWHITVAQPWFKGWGQQAADPKMSPQESFPLPPMHLFLPLPTVVPPSSQNILVNFRTKMRHLPYQPVQSLFVGTNEQAYLISAITLIQKCTKVIRLITV